MNVRSLSRLFGASGLLETMTADSLCRLSMIHAHRNDTVGIPEAVLLSEIQVAVGKSILHLSTKLCHLKLFIKILPVF